LQSVALSLVLAAENWSREKGSAEMGSDVELDNIMSQQFHKAIGFTRQTGSVATVRSYNLRYPAQAQKPKRKKTLPLLRAFARYFFILSYPNHCRIFSMISDMTAC
jgi:hypothetical protein